MDVSKVNNIGLEKEDLKKYKLFQQIKEKLDSDGKNEFSFNEGKILIAGDNFIFKLNNSYEKIYFFKNSKILFFSNKKIGIKKKPYFIHDQRFDNALQKTQIKNGELKDEMIIKKKEKILNQINQKALLLV